MNNKFYLFLIGCIGTRLLIAGLAWFIGKNKNTSWLCTIFGFVSISPSIWVYFYILRQLKKKWI